MREISCGKGSKAHGKRAGKKEQRGSGYILQHPGLPGTGSRHREAAYTLCQHLEGAGGLGEKRARREASGRQFYLSSGAGRGLWLTAGKPWGLCRVCAELEGQHGYEAPDRSALQAEPRAVLPTLGPMRLRDIRPQHLNKLYQALSGPQARADNERAQAKPQLWKVLEERGLYGDVPDGEGSESA